MRVNVAVLSDSICLRAYAVRPGATSMKILSILTYYHPHWTGLTAYAKRIAEGLAARGHEVTVLTTQHNPDLPLEEMIGGVRVIRLPVFMRISRGMVSLTYIPTASKLIRAHDLVQIHTPLMESMLIGALCKLHRKPLLMTHHGDLVMPAGGFNQIVERVVVGMMTQAERAASRISIHSRDYAENSDFLSHFTRKLAYIYPPVDIPRVTPEEARAWKAELGLADKRLIGFAGRFVEEKGFDFLLQAIPHVLERVPDAHWVYAGELNVVYEHFYDRWKHLIEQHRDHITILGLIKDPKRLAQFYAMCDAFCLPSRTDCFPSVQIEAMLSGAPVVTSDIPGAREVVKVTSMGRLARPGDPVALADALVEVLGNRERYTRTHEQIREVFDTTRTIDEYEALLAGMLGRPKPEPRAVNRRPAAPAPDVDVVRYREGLPRPFTSLTGEDHTKLDVILRNEADMAYRRRARVLLDYLELRDGDRVLDCGCGMGFYLMAMGKLRNLRLVGLDGDVQRLSWAERERVPAALVSSDIHRLPFEDNSFDRVLMSEVLEHLDDDRLALRELMRILKPGGILALSVPHARFPFWWDPINRVWTGLGGDPIRSGPIAGLWSNHVRLYLPEQLIERFRAAGFELEQVEESTAFSFPFIHFIVYGIGKPLLEKNLLPSGLRNSADRFSGEKNRGSRFNPINVGVSMFRAVDRLNETPRVERCERFVNILVKARKPAE